MTMLFLLIATALAADPDQTVRLEVTALWRPVGLRIYAEALWLGETVSTELVDDGSLEGDVPHDNVWVGDLTGDRLRGLQLRMLAESPVSGTVEIANSVEVVSSPSDRFSYVLEYGNRPRARRVAVTAPPRGVQMQQVAELAAIFGWAALIFLYVTWLVKRAMPADWR